MQIVGFIICISRTIARYRNKNSHRILATDLKVDHSRYLVDCAISCTYLDRCVWVANLFFCLGSHVAQSTAYVSCEDQSRRYVLNVSMSSCEVSLFFSDLTEFGMCCKNCIMNFGFIFVHFVRNKLFILDTNECTIDTHKYIGLTLWPWS